MLCVSNSTAMRFNFHLSFLLVASSLFALVQNPDNDKAYPPGAWVFVLALVISWVPSMDVASVAHRTFQHILGTIIGSCHCSLLWFSIFIDRMLARSGNIYWLCITIITFMVSFTMVQFKSSLFAKYPYSSLLCLMTFGISILPFYMYNKDGWKVGAWRVANVIMWCAIGGIGALLFWPRCTLLE